MWYLFKSVMRSLFHKLSKTLLILFSISVCAALIFANRGFQKTCENMFREVANRWYGKADFVIAIREDDTAKECIPIEGIKNMDGDIEYCVECIEENGLYGTKAENMDYFTFLGTGIIKQDAACRISVFRMHRGDIGDCRISYHRKICAGYSLGECFILGACAVVAMLAVSIAPLMKAQKISILESLKAE